MLDTLVRLAVGDAYPTASAQQNRRIRMLVAALFAVTFAATMAIIVNLLIENSPVISLSVAVLGSAIAANLLLLRITRSYTTVVTIFVVEQVFLLAVMTLMVGAIQPEFYIWYIVSLLLCTELVGRRVSLPLAVLYIGMVLVSQALFAQEAFGLPLQMPGVDASPISRTLTIINALIATGLIAAAYEASRERAERQIGHSEQQLRQHLDNTPLAALTIAPSGVITSWNRSAETIFGYARDAAIGASATLTLADTMPDHVRQAAVTALLANRQASNAITPNRTKDGQMILCAWYYTPLFDTDGEFSGMACLALDITNQTRAAEELRIAKEAAEASAHAKSQFLANISHEIRTPLNAVQGMTAALLDTQLSLEQQEIAATIQSGTQSLLHLLGDVLDLSRIEAGTFSIVSESFAIRDTLNDVVATLQPDAEAKGLVVSTHIDPAIPDIVRSDALRLYQILANLLDNAIKFTERGTITVTAAVRSATAEAYDVLFTVTDTGIGIPAGGINRLFQSFSQIDTSSTRRYGGAGLGLAISRRLANLLGGDMWLESSEGIGSTFYFNIIAAAGPVDPPPAPAPRPATLRAETGTARAISLLVVDDNLVNQKVSVNLIRKLGHDADVVDNGQAAVEAAKYRHYDLILMDIHMPVMDGLVATRTILAAAPPDRRPVIIALTAAVTAEDRMNALAAGMQDVLTKPIRLEQLADSIQRAFPPESASEQPTDQPGQSKR